jgi:glucose 1-dehydrogenase
MLETGIDNETKSHTYDSCIVESTMPRLMGKNVLVTGASSGIGEAIAIRFGQEGANVAINYHSSEARAEAVRIKVQAAGAGV